GARFGPRGGVPPPERTGGGGTWARGDPPGARVRIPPIPADVRRSASSVEWVDLPVPSPPSKVMNRPRIVLTGDGRERPQMSARRVRSVPCLLASFCPASKRDRNARHRRKLTQAAQA